VLPAEAHRAPGAPVVLARALILGAALAVALVAGCGDEEDDGETEPAGSGTELTITLDADGQGGEPEVTETVTCEASAEGTPCARLQAADLAPLDPATPCTEIYGGPDVAIIEGTLDGEEVSAALNRSNGCEIERFDRVTPLLHELFPGYEPGASLRP
jgi:hypothetical protein